MDNQRVWVPDVEAGFLLGRIIDIHYGQVTAQAIEGTKKKIISPYDRLYVAHVDDLIEFEDSCSMVILNEATLLHNIKLRYQKDNIYTYVASVLIVVNPYHDIKDLHSSATAKKYHGKSLGTMPPHVFAMADKSFRDMKSTKQSQSIIVSGESGAGKTETTKHILKYLCELSGTSAGSVEQRIQDANPILEAFGNSKTTRNNNSSRFGKFVKVYFDPRFHLIGGHILYYLLEKSRVCVQSPEERNYHVFYFLCAGAPEHIRKELELTNPDNYHYLNKGCRQYFTNEKSEKELTPEQKSNDHKKKGGLKDQMRDDVRDFRNMDKALDSIGLTEKEKYDIYSIVAAVLHLGNIAFEENVEGTKGGCRVRPNSEKTLATVSKLLGVDAGDLEQSLVSKVMMTNRGGSKGTVIMIPLKEYEANNARDALAKALYSNLFEHIVQAINKSIPYQKSRYFIGVLDIAGFECFALNSFEQFCINYCNEKLQQFFNGRVLKDEQELYRREGLNVSKIEFADNQDCLDLIEAKGTGILSLLDEESKLPKQCPRHFTSEVHRVWNGHFRLQLPRTSRLKAHREIRDDEGFLVRHFAGAVCYDTHQFIEKNNDALHTSLLSLMQESKNPFLKSLFPVTEDQKKGGKLVFESVSLKFKAQLAELMEKLKSTGTSFIKCIKPNEKMVHHRFDGGSILSQLRSSGVIAVLDLMQKGYPSRTVYMDLYNTYKAYLTKELKDLDPRTFCKSLFHAVGMKENDYCFGASKVFFRPGKFAEFDTIMKSDALNIKKILIKVRQWIFTHRWQKAQYCALAVVKLKNKILYRRKNLITLQKNVRMYLCQKKHRPRYKTIMKLKELGSMANSMETIVAQLRTDKDANEEKLKKLKADIESTQKLIKTDDNIKKEELDQIHLHLVAKATDLMGVLENKMSQQRNREEQGKLKKIHKEMDKGKKKKEEEELRKLRREDTRKRRAELEMRRKLEDEMMKQLNDEEIKTIEMIQAEQEKEATRLREQQEQERRDHDLALRLAKESNSQVEELTTVRVKESSRFSLRLGRKSYDLTKWKYSDLRDTINTSCDIVLLEACKHEFHRRLKVYHAWKAKNKRKFDPQVNERAPQSVMEEAQRAQKRGVVNQEGERKIDYAQRYFRIPFAKPVVANCSGQDSEGAVNTNVGGPRGWWYAHFDGQYVARQMELHPDKQAILLVAGIDDMQMCELSLDETGLTRKKGAEILAQEFNKEWERQGGKPYRSSTERALT